jgi:GH15 family glucan-1,4-alpha-glucosidase
MNYALMKKILFGLISLITLGLNAQEIPVPSEWKFTISDSAQFSLETYNDQHWRSIIVPSSWESQGFTDYDGIAWYRVSFTIPKNLTTDDLILFAGIIDDADETYLNGVLIGASGKFPPNDVSAWDLQRKYEIPKELIKSTNTLAIRVFDGASDGGIYGGKLSFLPKKQYDEALRQQLITKKSCTQLTISNGLIVAVYNVSTNRVENVYPHIFSAIDSGVFVQPFVRNIRLVAPSVQPISAEYCKNTHVVEVKYHDFSVYYFAPFTTDEKIFYAVIRGKPEVIASAKFEADPLCKGFLKTTYSINPSEICYLFSFEDWKGPDYLNKQQTLNQSTGKSLVDSEIRFMQDVFARCHFPENMNKKEKNLAEQSVTILKMAQVTKGEIFEMARGQILGALRPGNWAMSWVRDATYSIQALNSLGLYDEARMGLEFMLEATPTNQYKHYLHSDGKDYGIGVDYQISVTRYYGNGREESDFAGDLGPNIEIDGFGLFLTAFSDYVVKSGDTAFFMKWQPVVATKIADAIVNNIDADGLIRSESGPWEHHLPGQRNTNTSGVCSQGLRQFAQLQKSMNFPVNNYELAWNRLYQGIMKNMLYNNQMLTGTAEDNNPTDHYFYDAGTFELFANGLIQDAALFISHLQAYDPVMRVNESRGYIRIRSDDPYENQEWPYGGLRCAVAHARFGNRREATRLLNWFTELSSANYNLIPEIIRNQDAVYAGAVPIVSYGAGAYILALQAVKKM